MANSIAIAELWNAFRTYLQMSGLSEIVLRNLPRNPLVAIAIVERTPRNICAGVSEDKCYKDYILPKLEGDDAALLGSKIELLVVVLGFLAYPMYCNWIGKVKPSRSQIAVATASFVELIASWSVRALLVFRYSPAAYQSAVNHASACLLVVLMLYMWHVSPSPPNMLKVLAEQQRDGERRHADQARELRETMGVMANAMTGLAEKVCDIHRVHVSDMAANGNSTPPPGRPNLLRR